MFRHAAQHSYSRIRFFSSGTVRLLRFCRILVACCGLFLLVLGIASAVGRTFPVSLTVISFAGGLAAFWGNDMGKGRVTVTPSGIKSKSFLFHSAQKDEIESLDIVHSNFGKPDLTTPVLSLRSGKSFSLVPLIWSEQVGSEQPRWSYRQQMEIVHEIRSLLGVSGQD